MAREVATVIGSGTIPQTYGILDPAVRGSQSGAAGVRTGTQVVCANPEDFLAVDAFIASGVTVSTTPVEVIGPLLNLLPRCRFVTVQNRTPTSTVRIGSRADSVAASGFTLTTTAEAPLSKVTLPILHNVSVFAVEITGGPIELDLLIF